MPVCGGGRDTLQSGPIFAVYQMTIKNNGGT